MRYIEPPPGCDRTRIIYVPYYESITACGGNGVYAVDGIQRGEPQPFPAYLIRGGISSEPGKEPFMMAVCGDSMADAGIPEGCDILVNPVADANDGDAIVAEYYGDLMVKWIYWAKDGNGGELRAADPRYPVRRFTNDDIQYGNFKYVGLVCQSMSKPIRGE